MLLVQFGTSRNQSSTLTGCDQHSLIFYIRCLLMRNSRMGWTFLNFVKSASRKTETNLSRFSLISEDHITTIDLFINLHFSYFCDLLFIFIIIKL